MSKGDSVVVDFDFAKDGELVVRAPGSQRKVFKFDSVFGPQADQGIHRYSSSHLYNTDGN